MANMDRRAAGRRQPGKRSNSLNRARARARVNKAAERYTIAGPCTVTTADGCVTVQAPYTEAEQDKIKAGKGPAPAARIVERSA